MWLLHTTSLTLTEYQASPPPYAILSHRWRKDELTFGAATQTKAQGYSKIKHSCEIAKAHGLDYVWADTCCIDRRSSAELTEAINSMFAWYKEAIVCYAFLDDVQGLSDLITSEWFTRGWTLQELLAPANMEFYDRNWNLLGSKKNRKFCKKLARITQIPVAALTGSNLSGYCIAERMSWAASRRTSRIEDEAYCLLGIFDVNLSTVYGEREKAFQRLQEEIMKTSTDLSIFLWQGLQSSAFGMLALKPSYFSRSSGEISLGYEHSWVYNFSNSEGWTVTNAGIQMRAEIEPCGRSQAEERIYLLFLREPFRSETFAIYLALVDSTHDHIYHRVAVDGKLWTHETSRTLSAHGRYREIVDSVRISRTPLSEEDLQTRHRYKIHVSASRLHPFDCSFRRRPPLRDQEFQHPAPRLSTWPSSTTECDDDHKYTAESDVLVGFFGYVHLVCNSLGADVVICLGFNFFMAPTCLIIPFRTQDLCKEISAEDLEQAHRELSRKCDYGEYEEANSLFAVASGGDHALEANRHFGVVVEYSDAQFDINIDVLDLVEQWRIHTSPARVDVRSKARRELLRLPPLLM